MNCAPRAETGKASPYTAAVGLIGFVKQDEAFLRDLLDRAECLPAPDCQGAAQPGECVAAALSALRREGIPVVLCDRDEMPDAWKELLRQFASLSQPPCLIVTSRLADEYLWAEALNLGAYDVLARPFDAGEVVRSVNLARSHWQSRTAAPRVARAVA